MNVPDIRARPSAHLWLRKSAYHDSTKRAGCRGYEVSGYTQSDMCLFPAGYSDPEAEYRHLVEDVVVIDVPDERPVEIAGRDAAAFADYLVTRDLRACKPGQGKYVLMTDQNGGLIADSILWPLAADRIWLSGDFGWIKGLAVASAMDVEVIQTAAAPLQIQGPKSRAVVRALFGETVARLSFFGFTVLAYHGRPLIVTRSGFTGELGYELYLCNPDGANELWNDVMEAGKVHDIAPATLLRSRRIEAGLLSARYDFTLDENPYEVGLGAFVDLDKPANFVGREALHRIRCEGICRRLTGYTSGTLVERPMTDPWPVVEGNTLVGRATAAERSPALGCTIGYAIVPVNRSEPGTRLTIRAPWGEMAAVATTIPFVDPERRRLRS